MMGYVIGKRAKRKYRKTKRGGIEMSKSEMKKRR